MPEEIKFSRHIEDLPAIRLEDINLDELLKTSDRFFQKQVPKKIEDRIKEATARSKELKNQDREQDIILKKRILLFLMILLGLETVIIFLLSFPQGTRHLDFFLEEWNFRLLVGATITQTYFMLRIAIQYLFPRR